MSHAQKALNHTLIQQQSTQRRVLTQDLKEI